jgi:hypothetical protein
VRLDHYKPPADWGILLIDSVFQEVLGKTNTSGRPSPEALVVKLRDFCLNHQSSLWCGGNLAHLIKLRRGA